MKLPVPENFGEELDALLIPILGKNFRIERNHHGAYIIHASSGHVFSIPSNEHEGKYEIEHPKRKTS